MAESSKEMHLCVVVHGLWGNPSHLSHVQTSLRAAFPEDELHILVAKRNSNTLTYDGIETGGERVTHEVEDELAVLEKEGKKVTRLSMTGYSLGGLFARYAVGLLYHKGYFDKGRIQPVNFTTFATPHLGTRTPLLGFHSSLYNTLGSRTLSISGRQLFLTDDFRDTGRPLLSILADPSSVFIRGLSAFKKRSLYANIVNDRTVPFFTACFSAIDPFSNLDAININYVEGYEDVILDGNNMATRKAEQPTYYETLSSSARSAVERAPMVLAMTAILPLGAVVYLANSGIQAYRSAARIKLHEDGKAGIETDTYRLPPMLEKAQQRVDSAVESIAGLQQPDTLPEKSETSTEPLVRVNSNASASLEPTSANAITTTNIPGNDSEFPTLALAPEQFEMIKNLQAVGWDKYPVHIHNAMHSHAAMIVRMNRDGFSEGKIVSRHWTERFEL